MTKTYVINNEPDGVNINGSTHIEGLQTFVAEKNLDVGFGYGDAGSCFAIDEKGSLIDGDAILYMCGQYFKEKGRLNINTVVTTIMSNLGLQKVFDAAGIDYEKITVGDKYVNQVVDVFFNKGYVV